MTEHQYCKKCNHGKSYHRKLSKKTINSPAEQGINETVMCIYCMNVKERQTWYLQTKNPMHKFKRNRNESS